MNSMIPYIVFPGTCKQAMEFYSKILNGTITSIQTFGASPIPVAEECKDRIFDAELKAGNILFKASDDLPDHAVHVGNNISLFVSLSDNSFKKEVFEKLSEGGKILFPLDENFGMLRDKYNVQWMFVGKK